MTEQELQSEARNNLMPPYCTSIDINVTPTTKQTNGSTTASTFSSQQSTINTDISKRLNYCSSTSVFYVDAFVQK